MQSTLSHCRFTLRKGLLKGSCDAGQTFHKAPAFRYPRVKVLPLPNSVEDIVASERLRFSPNRLRDINGYLIAGDVSRSYSDTRVRSYDCSGSVSLHAHMQTNVPSPCLSVEMFTHFNMPGGLWCQGDKYLAGDYSKARSMLIRRFSTNMVGRQKMRSQGVRLNSTKPEEKLPPAFGEAGKVSGKPSYDGLTRAQKLKTAVKEYGSVVIVFHVGISLLSLGGCYMFVTSGVDLQSLLGSWLPTTDGGAAAATAAPFVVAYAIHKAFAPVRITITLVSVPLIVRHLRRIGFIKPPKPKPPST